MKKYLFIICLFIFLVGFTACDEASKYEIKNDVQIVDKINYNDLKELLTKLDINKENNVSMELLMTQDSLDGVQKLNYTIDYIKENGNINAIAKFNLKNYSYTKFIKDSVIYITHDQVKTPVKTNILSPNAFNFNSLCMSDKDYKIILDATLDYIFPQSPNLSHGYDKDKNVIIDYKAKDITFRFVFNDNKPIYLYVYSGNYGYEYKFSYDCNRIKKPSGFNEDDYEKITWKEYVSLGY